MREASRDFQTDRLEEFPGFHPSLISAAVRNTAPFIFDFDSQKSQFQFVKILNEHCEGQPLSLSQYFDLCIAAHFATVATFVPTDLDQTIRLKLWRIATPDQIEGMVESVFHFLEWNDESVSRRFINSKSGVRITGHYGEWFTLAIPAFIKAKQLNLSVADKLLDAIVDLVRQHDAGVAELIASSSAFDLFTASALIAHNFGDLDRAFDLWEISDDEILKKEIYKLGHRPRPGYKNIFIAGEVNKKFTAAESHRHFALRKPRSLRVSEDFLIGMGPFYDEWGRRIAEHPGLNFEERSEILEALVDGWERLNRVQPVFGYARAIHGFFSAPRGRDVLEGLPASRKKLIRTGALALMLSTPTEVFQSSWSARLQKYLKTFGS